MMVHKFNYQVIKQQPYFTSLGSEVDLRGVSESTGFAKIPTPRTLKGTYGVYDSQVTRNIIRISPLLYPPDLPCAEGSDTSLL